MHRQRLLYTAHTRTHTLAGKHNGTRATELKEASQKNKSEDRLKTKTSEWQRIDKYAAVPLPVLYSVIHFYILLNV